jgi:peptide/nickel transport system permease protein
MARSAPGLILGLVALLSLLTLGRTPPFALEHALEGPSAAHWWGFDPFGRDLFHLWLSAAGTSLIFALACAALSIGLALCLLILFTNARTRDLGALPRFIDFVLAFPSLLVSLAIVAYLKPGPGSLVAALTLGTFPALTRLLILRTRELLSEPFIEAAISLGANRFHLTRIHLFPHYWPLIWVKVPGLVAGTLVAEASLTFLGVGLPKGQESWGSLLLTAKDYMIEAPHIMICTGVPLVLTIALLQGLRKS